MSELKIKFEAAQARSQNLPKQPPSVQLDLYGLFKRATSGLPSGKRPGALDMRGRAKYDAWNSRAGLSEDQAMTEYINYIDKLAGF